MKINGNEVKFEWADMSFVKKFGIFQATETVLDYKSLNRTPFIFDAFQLSSLLGTDKVSLFYVIKNKKELYRTITLKKKNGKTRKITAPDFKLSCMQSRILHEILDKMPISQYATAYHKGAKLLDNAKPHTNKKYILKLDITDFFGSITFLQILSSVFNIGIFQKQIGYLLTELCTLDDVLPQGAPTSPAISNIVMKHFDDNIGQWCKQNGINYTRYCDDMTFSSDKPLYHVYKKAESMLIDMGFMLNEKKTKFISSSSRQTVTGLTVNEKVSVPREYKRDLRQQIHYLLKYDFDRTSVMCALKGNKHKPSKDENYRDWYYRIIGKIKYVLQIEPDNEYFIDALKKLSTIKE